MATLTDLRRLLHALQKPGAASVPWALDGSPPCVPEGELLGVCAIDAAGTCRLANGACADLFGYRDDGIVGQPFIDHVVPPEKREEYRSIHDAILKLPGDGLPAALSRVSLSDVLQKKSGEPIHVTLSSPELVTLGTHACVLWAVREVEDSCVMADACRAADRGHRLEFEMSLDAILVVDSTTRTISHANRAVARLLGRAATELHRQPLRALDGGEELERLLDGDGLIGSGAGRRIALRRADGAPVHVEAGYVRAVSGTGDCHILVLRDVSDRVRAESELRAAHAEISAIIDASPAAIFSIDGRGFITSWNRSAERMFGWKEEEVVGRFNPIVPTEKLPEFQALRARALVGELLQGVELERRRKDGSPIDVSLWSAPLRDENGEVRRIMGVMVDITERRKAERALAASESRYRALAETASDMIFVVDRDDRVSYVNAAAAGFLRRSKADIAGKLRSELFPQDVAERQGQKLATVIATRKPTRAEDVYPEWGVWLETVLVPLLDDAGSVSAVMGVARDVTERKRLEDARSSFFTSVSHDLRTPLTIILGYSEMLREGEIPATYKKGVEAIARRARQQLRMVDDLLVHAAIEAGRLQLERRDVRLGDFLEEYLEEARLMVDGLAEQRYPHVPRRFETNLHPDAMNAVAAIDGARLRQVLDNLLDNAVKYSGPAGVDVALLAEPCGEGVELRVRDRGIGVPERERARVFEPFYRVRDGRGDRPTGFGKGLSIVKEIVAAHGGRVRIEPAPGGGTDACFTLPCRAGACPPPVMAGH